MSKYQKNPEAPFYRNVGVQARRQRLFKKMAGKSEVPLATMKLHCQKIEQCNRLLLITRYIKMNSLYVGGFVDYRFLVAVYGKYSSHVVSDLDSWGLRLQDGRIHRGDIGSLEQKIGARKGAYRRKDQYYRSISNAYLRWAEKRDAFGGRA